MTGTALLQLMQLPKLQLDDRDGGFGRGLHAGGFAAFHAARTAGHVGTGFFLGFFTGFVAAVVGESGSAGQSKQGEGEQGIFHNDGD